MDVDSVDSFDSVDSVDSVDSPSRIWSLGLNSNPSPSPLTRLMAPFPKVVLITSQDQKKIPSSRLSALPRRSPVLKNRDCNKQWLMVDLGNCWFTLETDGILKSSLVYLVEIRVCLVGNRL
jgi:hypothetical protein